MSDTKEAARLDWLEARARITDLVHAYTRAVRTGDGAGCSSLFTEDAVFETRERGADGEVATRSRLEGGEQIRAFFAGSIKPGQLFPMIHNLLIDIQGDRATSNCVMVAGVEGGTPRFMGVYEDSYRRDPEWRFTGRVFTINAWHG